jgi:hypothetical protein
MVVKNNYFWLKDSGHAGFVQWDIIEVLRFSISRNCTDLSLLMSRMIDYQIKSQETVLLWRR